MKQCKIGVMIVKKTLVIKRRSEEEKVLIFEFYFSTLNLTFAQKLGSEEPKI
jgi:hypothetical protein